jgi:hypothetical protein
MQRTELIVSIKFCFPLPWTDMICRLSTTDWNTPLVSVRFAMLTCGSLPMYWSKMALCVSSSTSAVYAPLAMSLKLKAEIFPVSWKLETVPVSRDQLSQASWSCLATEAETVVGAPFAPGAGFLAGVKGPKVPLLVAGSNGTSRDSTAKAKKRAGRRMFAFMAKVKRSWWMIGRKSFTQRNLSQGGIRANLTSTEKRATNRKTKRM